MPIRLFLTLVLCVGVAACDPAGTGYGDTAAGDDPIPHPEQTAAAGDSPPHHAPTAAAGDSIPYVEHTTAGTDSADESGTRHVDGPPVPTLREAVQVADFVGIARIGSAVGRRQVGGDDIWTDVRFEPVTTLRRSEQLPGDGDFTLPFFGGSDGSIELVVSDSPIPKAGQRLLVVLRVGAPVPTWHRTSGVLRMDGDRALTWAGREVVGVTERGFAVGPAARPAPTPSATAQLGEVRALRPEPARAMTEAEILAAITPWVERP
jgi:hypothetical protein